MREAIFAMSAFMLAVATPAVADPSPKSQALAKRYVAALQMEKQMAGMIDGLMPGIISNSVRARGLKVNDELRSRLLDIAAESIVAFTPKLMDAMLPALAESFTEAELEAAVTYYESPLGQSLLAKSPAFMAKAGPAVTALMPAMEKDLDARLCREFDCNAK